MHECCPNKKQIADMESLNFEWDSPGPSHGA